jgi:hypothetical protein
MQTKEPEFSPCEQALHVVDGARADAYGSASQSLANIAHLWSVVMKRTVTIEQVALCMILLKVARENNKHQDDNLTDICGYTEILARARRECELL